MVGTEETIQAVEDLTNSGSTGFYPSAVAQRARTSVQAATAALTEMVQRGDLRLRFDLVCPGNGRTVKQFNEASEVPLGTLWEDNGVCDEPFVVEKRDVMIAFVPTERYRIRVQRQRAREPHPSEGDPPGLLRRILGKHLPQVRPPARPSSR